MKILKFNLLFILSMLFLSCGNTSKNKEIEHPPTASTALEFNAEDKALEQAFYWAKEKALSFAHDNSDPVGYWYEAALPNRQAFCMRDVSHQTIGAEILGLSKHNYNMFLKFAQNISENLDYCSYWEINKDNLPAPVDFESNTDFWYNLPANFDVTFSAYRLYQWTGNTSYLEQPDFKEFYKLSMNEYVDHWSLGHDKVRQRDRSMHLNLGDTKSRFGDKRGIPTYNEGGRGETLLGIDMTASLIAAYRAYANILKLNGDILNATKMSDMAVKEQRFLDEYWWDEERKEFKSILYEDNSFDYFMVGDNQAFLHYLYYFDTISNQEKLKGIVEGYKANFDKLIVELKSYLPIMFYEYGDTAMANKMIIDLCSENNKRRDYPENSYTVIEHLTRGYMGVNVNASEKHFSTLSRLDKEDGWAELRNVPLLSNKISVLHQGVTKTTATNQSGEAIQWIAKFPGTHEVLFIDGKRSDGLQDRDHGKPYTYVSVQLTKGAASVVSVNQ